MVILLAAKTCAIPARLWVQLCLMKVCGWDDVVLILAHLMSTSVVSSRKLARASISRMDPNFRMDRLAPLPPKGSTQLRFVGGIPDFGSMGYDILDGPEYGLDFGSDNDEQPVIDGDKQQLFLGQVMSRTELRHSGQTRAAKRSCCQHDSSPMRQTCCSTFSYLPFRFFFFYKSSLWASPDYNVPLQDLQFMSPLVPRSILLERPSPTGSTSKVIETPSSVVWMDAPRRTSATRWRST